jgi:hypothetical protein
MMAPFLSRAKSSQHTSRSAGSGQPPRPTLWNKLPYASVSLFTRERRRGATGDLAPPCWSKEDVVVEKHETGSMNIMADRERGLMVSTPVMLLAFPWSYAIYRG